MLSSEDVELVQRWPGLSKEFVFWACDFSLDSGFSGVQDTKGQDFHCIIIFSLHALIFLIDHFTRCMF